MNSIRNWMGAVGVAALLVVAGCGGGGSAAHRMFDTPEQAADALAAAAAADDAAAVTALFGPDAAEIADSGDPVMDAVARKKFAEAYAAKHALVADGDDKRTLVVGAKDWPLPVPLVRRDGKWMFDGAAGLEEVAFRRIGRNELGAIAVCLGFHDAQHEYASTGHDDMPAGLYASKLISDLGTHNGLYWPAVEGEPVSPVGPFVAQAAAQGYRRAAGDVRPYHGYQYRGLFKQGPHANGGAKEYFDKGALVNGFALLAWPAEYGTSGVLTFMVNQDGVVYEKDLGEDTESVVEGIRAFDPDTTWSAVEVVDEEDDTADE